jgi:hypothetical protein
MAIRRYQEGTVLLLAVVGTLDLGGPTKSGGTGGWKGIDA